MIPKFCKVALSTGLLCLTLLPSVVHAEITPELYNLLATASAKDGGKDFNALVEIMVSANPNDEAEIRLIAADLKPKQQPKQTISTMAPAKGTIFSDSGAAQLSQAFLPGWDKEIEVNALFSSGNTLQKSFGTGTKFHRETGPFQQTVTTYFDYNSSNSVTNKRRYGIALKNDYSINDISYITGYTSFEGDSFGAFNKRLTLNGGYGIRVFDNDTYKWSVEAGPALLMTKPISTDDYDKDLTGYASSFFSWAINERSEFSNETKIYAGSKVVIETKTDYKLKVSGALSGKLSFDVLYNRDAPLGRKKTDTITRVGLLYDF